MTEVDLFPQGIDGLLDVGKVHGLNIADDWHDESLHRQTVFGSMLVKLLLDGSKSQLKGVKGQNLWSCNSDADVHVIPVDDLFGGVVDDCGSEHFSSELGENTRRYRQLAACGHTCVDCGLIGQRVSSSLDERRHEAQFDVVLLQKCVLVNFPHFLDVAGAQTHTERSVTLFTSVCKWTLSK